MYWILKFPLIWAKTQKYSVRPREPGLVHDIRKGFLQRPVGIYG